MQHVRSDHIRVPYAADTAPIVIDFLFSLVGTGCDEREMQSACAAFEETAKQMEGAQETFRGTWNSSKYAGVDYSRASAGTVALSAASRKEYAAILPLLPFPTALPPPRPSPFLGPH